jgi:hypothetical protein
MNNFLADLAAKSFDHAEVIGPRLPSLFEPWLGETDSPTFSQITQAEASTSFKNEGPEPSQQLTRDFSVEPFIAQTPKPSSNVIFENNAYPADEQQPSFSGINPSQTSTNTERKDSSAELLAKPANQDKPKENSSATNQHIQETNTTPQQSKVALDQKQTLTVGKQIPESLTNKNDAGVSIKLLSYPAKNNMEYRDVILPVIATKVVTQENTNQGTTLIVQVNPVNKECSSELIGETKKHFSPFVPQNKPAKAVFYSESGFANINPSVAESQPTINVSIGRIEVRVTPAPSAQYKPKTTAKTMSLDDYLRQRTDGGKS